MQESYVCLLIVCFSKHGRREDNNFEEIVAIKSNLQPHVLQGKLVMLTFWSNVSRLLAYHRVSLSKI